MGGGQDIDIERPSAFDLLNEKVVALTNALRALAIIPTMAPGVREVVHDGHRCRVCATTWDLTKPERHQDWCALKGTEI